MDINKVGKRGGLWDSGLLFWKGQRGQASLVG